MNYSAALKQPHQKQMLTLHDIRWFNNTTPWKHFNKVYYSMYELPKVLK